MPDVLPFSALVLFLDFDGVLHPDPPVSESPLLCRAPLIQQWLTAHPNVAVVISSTWRVTRSLDQLKALFPEWRERIVGVTPNIPAESFQRQGECEAWMREHANPWTPWLALDDRPWNFRPFEKRLILVERTVGLTNDDLLRLSAAVHD